MKRIMRNLIILILAAGLAVSLSAQEQQNLEEIDAVLVELKGKVEIKLANSKQWFAAYEGLQLPLSSTISTGFNSTALLTYGENKVTMKPLTRVTLDWLLKQEDTVSTQLFLKVGKLHAEVESTAGIKQDFKVRTPYITASAKGSGADIGILDIISDSGLWEIAPPEVRTELIQDPSYQSWKAVQLKTLEGKRKVAEQAGIEAKLAEQTALQTEKEREALEQALSGATSEEERAMLRRYAEGRTRAVEIGVYEGVNTRNIAEVMDPKGVVYGVDPFPKGRLGLCWGELIAATNLRRGGVRDRVTFVRALSWDAASMVEGEFDLLYVDGDHTLDAMQRDWSDWSGRVLKDGIVALHDTRVSEFRLKVESYGSYQYFESDIRHDERFELLEQVDSLSVLRRR